MQSVPAPQVLPPAQRAQLVEPPQSMAVSLPFLTPSLQDTSAQSSPVQTPLTQSLPAVQSLPTAHLFVPAQAPPQSTSVSVWFLTPSLQVAARQVPAVQTPLEQSPFVAQILVSAQSLPGTQPPPQSVSVSVPFLTESLQVGALQVVAQTPLVQSVAALQVTPSAHLRAGAQIPPQSTPVSVWFLALSVQVAAVQRLPEHSVLMQSVPAVQASPAAQRLQVLVPPQSIADSP